MARRDVPDQAGLPEAQQELREAQHLIGATVMAWSDLEYKLIALLAKLAQCPSYVAGILFYSQSSLKSQLGTIRNLATLNTASADDREAIIEALDKLSKLSKVRNKFVHSVYTLSYDPKRRKPKFEVVSSSFQSSISEIIKREKVNVSSMRDHIKTVSLMSFQINHLTSEFSNSITPAHKLDVARAEQKQKLDIALQMIRGYQEMRADDEE